MISLELKHPFIVEYKYFIHEYNREKDRYRTHTLIEHLGGKDLHNYINVQNDKRKNGELDEKELMKTAKLFGG